MYTAYTVQTIHYTASNVAVAMEHEQHKREKNPLLCLKDEATKYFEYNYKVYYANHLPSMAHICECVFVVFIFDGIFVYEVAIQWQAIA